MLQKLWWILTARGTQKGEKEEVRRRQFAKISQSRRRPLLGPSPGWKCLLALKKRWNWDTKAKIVRAGLLSKVKVLCGTFNQEKALVGAVSVIVKSSRTFVASSSRGAQVGVGVSRARCSMQSPTIFWASVTSELPYEITRAWRKRRAEPIFNKWKIVQSSLE